MDRPVFVGGWQRKEVVGCSSELGHRVDFQPMVLEFDETERGEARSEVRGGGGGGEIDEWDHTVIVGLVVLGGDGCAPAVCRGRRPTRGIIRMPVDYHYVRRMNRTLLAPAMRSTLDTGSDLYLQNREDMSELLQVHDELLEMAATAGGEKAINRHRSRGKLQIRERIAAALDPDTPFLEITPLAGYGSAHHLGGGMVAGIGIIAGVECVIMGNDPTVAAGALTPYASKKWMRGTRDRPRQPHSVHQFRRVRRWRSPSRRRRKHAEGRRQPARGRRFRRHTGPFRRDRSILLRDDRALEDEDPDGVCHLRLVDRWRARTSRV